MVNVNSTGSSSVRFITTAPTLGDSILEGWFVGDEFATHNGAKTAIAALGTYAAQYTPGDLGGVPSNATQNLKPSGAQTTLAAAKTFNSLNLTGSIGATIAPGITLTLDSGSLINSGTGNISGGTIFSNNREWIAKYSGSSAINSVITGNAGFTKLGAGNLTLGAASTYGNKTTINEGTLTLAGGNNTLAVNAAMVLNGGTLRLDNGNAVTASRDVADRLSGSAITMNGGTLIYQGRIGYNSTESVGAVTANTGNNVINAAAGGTGVNSAQLTLASLTRATGAEIEINRGSGSSLGFIGNSPRVLVTAALTGNLAPVNCVVPGVFISTSTDNYHFAGYSPGLGFGPLGTAGFPTTTSNFATAGAADNVQDPGAGTAVVSANKTINSLRQGALTFTNGTTTGGTDLLTIGSGMAIMQTETWATPTQRGRITSGTQELFIMHRDGNGVEAPRREWLFSKACSWAVRPKRAVLKRGNAPAVGRCSRTTCGCSPGCRNSPQQRPSPKDAKRRSRQPRPHHDESPKKKASSDQIVVSTQHHRRNCAQNTAKTPIRIRKACRDIVNLKSKHQAARSAAEGMAKS